MPPARVLEVARELVALGVQEVSLGDTIGVAVPTEVEAVLDLVLAALPVQSVALHFHDTRGTALANLTQALAYGVAIFDAAAGGLGGCPYAPGATGNVATEAVDYLLHGMGIQTGVNLQSIIQASSFIAQRIGRPLTSKVYQAEQAARGRAG